MNQPIQSAKTTEVAELFRLNLQFFNDEYAIEEPTETIEDVQPDETTETPENETVETGENEQDSAEPAEPSFKDDPQNQAFAQIRREKEAYEAQVRAMDAEISRTYGESHGIHTFAEYQAALEAERQEQERMKYREAGLPDEVIEKLSKVDQVLEQAEREKMDRALIEGFSSLQQEYPGLVKTPEDIPPEAWVRYNDGKSGLSLIEAYELSNKQQIREHLKASSKQAALNKLNGKSHIRGNGGEGADDIDLGVVPPDVLQQYRAMFKKELRTGEMTEKDFVKHYKNSK